MESSFRSPATRLSGRPRTEHRFFVVDSDGTAARQSSRATHSVPFRTAGRWTHRQFTMTTTNIDWKHSRQATAIFGGGASQRCRAVPRRYMNDCRDRRRRERDEDTHPMQERTKVAPMQISTPMKSSVARRPNCRRATAAHGPSTVPYTARRDPCQAPGLSSHKV